MKVCSGSLEMGVLSLDVGGEGTVVRGLTGVFSSGRETWGGSWFTSGPWVPDAVGVKGTQCGSSWRARQEFRRGGVQKRRGQEEEGPRERGGARKRGGSRKRLCQGEAGPREVGPETVGARGLGLSCQPLRAEWGKLRDVLPRLSPKCGKGQGGAE